MSFCVAVSRCFDCSGFEAIFAMVPPLMEGWCSSRKAEKAMAKGWPVWFESARSMS